MSTRRFCDLCDQPAVEPGVLVQHREKTKDVGTIAIRLTITSEQHPTGYGGPPDLCEGCISALIKKLKLPKPRAKKG